MKIVNDNIVLETQDRLNMVKTLVPEVVRLQYEILERNGHPGIIIMGQWPSFGVLFGMRMILEMPDEDEDDS